MKIAILTQPLTNNYGGLLQAFALQTALERMGHEIVLLNRPMPFVPDVANDSLRKSATRFAKNVVKRIVHKPITKVYHELLPQQWLVVNRFTEVFTVSRLNKSPDFSTTESLAAYCSRQHFDAYVVGSDQCWRPLYSPCLPNYFLDFTSGWNVKRVAYAASFGVDCWEYTEEETRTCAPLARLFDAVSVRESSGVSLCKEHLGVDAVHVADPTMLLDSNDYDSLIKDYNPSTFNVAPDHRVVTTEDVDGRKLFCYMLDQDPSKDSFIQTVAKAKDLTPVQCMPKDFRAQEVFGKCPDDCTFPPVELWARSFREADMVVTDSFHGTVFSIIYNKPFWVLANHGRGLARIHSLLKKFGLEDRLVATDNLAIQDFDTPVDWDTVNTRREAFKQKSLLFLKENL